MNNVNYYINLTHGMELSPIKKSRERRHNENGILYFVEYLLLRGKAYNLSEYDKEEDKKLFKTIAKNLQVKGFPGLYDRGEGESDITHQYYIKPKNRRLISHDNLTALSCGSILLGTNDARDIAKRFLKTLGRFDNKHPSSPHFNKESIYHPRDWFMFLYNGGGLYQILSYLFYPIFFLSCLEAVLQRDTCRPDILRSIQTFFKTKKWPSRTCFPNSSGPLLYFVRLERFTWKQPLMFLTKHSVYFMYRKLFGHNWIEVVCSLYYLDHLHPNRLLSRGF